MVEIACSALAGEPIRIAQPLENRRSAIDLREGRTPFPEIYCGSPVFQGLRNPNGFSGKCGACNFNHFCGGSRSTAYALTGDYLASDPSCAYVPPGYDGELPEGVPAEGIPQI